MTERETLDLILADVQRLRGYIVEIQAWCTPAKAVVDAAQAWADARKMGESALDAAALRETAEALLAAVLSMPRTDPSNDVEPP